MVELKKVSVERNGKEVIKNFSHNFKPGSATLITGENGAGKSTLLAAIAGDLKFTGEINYFGQPVGDISISELANLRSVLLQEVGLNFPLTVREFLRLAKPKSAESNLERLAKLLKISEILEKKVTELSVGQLQRVEIAQVLIQDAKVLILDEPFASQDAAAIKVLNKLFAELKRAGKILIVASHISSKSMNFFDQKINLNR